VQDRASLWVLKTKPFARFARKAGISDTDLWETACAVSAGAIDADLGGGVIKQRIARAGQGKSGGFRSIILFRRRQREVFVYGFDKKDRANIDAKELEGFRELADVILSYSEDTLERLVKGGALGRIEKPMEV